MKTVFNIMKLRFGEGRSSRSHGEEQSELLLKDVVNNIEQLNFLELEEKCFIGQDPSLERLYMP